MAQTCILKIKFSDFYAHHSLGSTGTAVYNLRVQLGIDIQYGKNIKRNIGNIFNP